MNWDGDGWKGPRRDSDEVEFQIGTTIVRKGGGGASWYSTVVIKPGDEAETVVKHAVAMLAREAAEGILKSYEGDKSA